MSRVCRITPRASRDIEAIADYLATQGDLTHAEQFLKGIDSTLQRILNFLKLDANEMNSILAHVVCPTNNSSSSTACSTMILKFSE